MKKRDVFLKTSRLTRSILPLFLSEKGTEYLLLLFINFLILNQFNSAITIRKQPQ